MKLRIFEIVTHFFKFILKYFLHIWTGSYELHRCDCAFNWRVSSHKSLANYSAEGLVTESHTHLTLSSWFILRSKYNHNAALIFAVERPEPKICSPKFQVRHHYQYQYFLKLEQCMSISHGDFKTAPMQICRFDQEETTLTQGYILKVLRIFRLHQKVLQKMVWGFKFLNSIC